MVKKINSCKECHYNSFSMGDFTCDISGGDPDFKSCPMLGKKETFKWEIREVKYKTYNKASPYCDKFKKNVVDD